MEEKRAVEPLVLAIERLAENNERLADNQCEMSKEIKELTRAISKMDVILEKMVMLEEKHGDYRRSTDKRLEAIEKEQTVGCPALREHKAKEEGDYKSVMLEIAENRRKIEEVAKTIHRVTWLVVSLVLTAVVGGVMIK